MCLCLGSQGVGLQTTSRERVYSFTILMGGGGGMLCDVSHRNSCNYKPANMQIACIARHVLDSLRNG